MTITLPPFAVSQFTTWHLSFEQDVELYRKCNVDGIELCERKLSPDRQQAMRQLGLLRDSGLKVASVQPRCHALFPDSMSPDPAEPQRRVKCYEQTIDMIAEAFPGQDIPLVTLTGIAPERNLRHAHETARRLYQALADYAGDRGLRIMLEPLHPMFMNTDTFICTMRDAQNLVESVDRDNFGIAIDTFHVFAEPDASQRLKELGRHIFAVHVSDWPLGFPRTPGDRLLPGDGCIDLACLLGGIEAAGYQGAYTLEIFSADELVDSLWQQDPQQVIERGRAGFYNAWNNRKRAGISAKTQDRQSCL